MLNENVIETGISLKRGNMFCLLKHVKLLVKASLCQIFLIINLSSVTNFTIVKIFKHLKGS